MVYWVCGKSNLEGGPDMMDHTSYPEAQVQRLKYIDFCLYFMGRTSRKEHMERYGLGSASATRDFAIYREHAPSNAYLDQQTKLYMASESFEPQFPHSAVGALCSLTQGYTPDADEKAWINHEAVALFNEPGVGAVSTVTRAIALGCAVHIQYMTEGGQRNGEVVPFATAHDGQRWYFRAYDRKYQCFTTFAFSRLIEGHVLTGSKAGPDESWGKDYQWMRIVDLPLVPHPANIYPELIRHDYGITDEVLSLRVRGAMAGLVLRQYQVDCSSDHSLDELTHRLWLSDPLTLYGVESARYAPGYMSSN